MRWITAYALAILACLAVAWPPRVRIEAPRTGIPCAGILQAATSLPGLLPPHLAPQGPSIWRFNRVLFEGPPAPLRPAGRFRLVHIADLAPKGKEDLLDLFLEDMVAVKPDAVLVTGDLAYDESPRWYDRIVGFLQTLEARGIRVAVVPGNHERKGWTEYLRHFGPLVNHRLDLGPLRILSLDSAHGRDRLTPSQVQWLESELRSSAGRIPILQLHHPVFSAGPAVHGEAGGSGGSLHGFQRKVIRLCEEWGVAAVLSGHWHADAVFDSEGRLRDDQAEFPGTKFIVTTAQGNEARRVTRWPKVGHGFRVLDFDQCRLVRYTHGLTPSGAPQPIASTPLGKGAEVPEFPR